MANGFQNPVMYTDETLRILMNNIVMGKRVSRTWEKDYGKQTMQIGDTLNIRRPARFTVSTGQAFQAQDYTETSVPLVVNLQKHVDTAFTSADLTLKVQDFSDRVLKPKIVQLAQQIDIDGYINAKNTVSAMTGIAGTSPNNISYLFDIGKKLDDFSTPRDGERYYALDQGSNASQVGALAGFFNSVKQISDQYKDGMFADMTETVGLKIAMSQNVARQTVGPLGGTPVVNGANQGLTAGWANTGTLITNGWTSAAAQRVAAGDNFTIAGLFSVNPVTKQSNTSLAQFTVIQNQNSDASGNLTLQITPAIITAGPFQNVAASPTNSNALTFSGVASTAYARNIAWHKDAFELAVVKMIDLAEFGGWGAVRVQDGFSLRVFRQAAISSDTVGNRVDALYGYATPYQELASQQVSA